MKRIFTGPSLVAKRIIAELNELGIQPVPRNDHQSATMAGFGAGMPDQILLFVRDDQYEQAIALVNELKL